MDSCQHCGTKFEQPGIGRQKLFCSRKCFRADYRKRGVPAPAGTEHAVCFVCGQSFVKTTRHQRYCSSKCYGRSAYANHPKKLRERSRLHRVNSPEWYQEREPKYYRTYRGKQVLDRPWRYLFQSRRTDAKNRGLIFELTDEWARARWKNHCEITGIEFRKNGTRGPHPFSPSVDRIDSNIGYTQANCRFVLWGCNAIKGVGTDDDMYEIAQAIVRSMKPSSTASDNC